MAIIKCPECGRQISDKAPVCPNCGVQIAGKIIKCPECGEIYFRDQPSCPICHHATNTATDYRSQQVETDYNRFNAAPTRTPADTTPGNRDTHEPPKRGRGWLVGVAILVVILASVSFYFYSRAKADNENEAYRYAMTSNDPLVMQNYLDNNPDAPTNHRDSVEARLEQLKQIDNDWNNAVISGSKEAIMEYLTSHPDSKHRMEALFKVDSIDWSLASNQNTLEAVQQYVTEHPNGRYLDEANEALKGLKSKTVTPEEKQAVVEALRRFYRSVNTRNSVGLEESVSDVLTNFLGKSYATKEDVLSFMNKIYKEDMTNMNWRLGSDIKIDKKEVGDDKYEYSVQCSAVQQVEYQDVDKNTSNKYRIKATVSPDNTISALTMVKILE